MSEEDKQRTQYFEEKRRELGQENIETTNNAPIMVFAGNLKT